MADPAPHLAIPLSDDPPLHDLWTFAGRHRAKVFFASAFSVLNKACDVAPELLDRRRGRRGGARAASRSSARVFGVEDQLRRS